MRSFVSTADLDALRTAAVSAGEGGLYRVYVTCGIDGNGPVAGGASAGG